MIYYFVGEKNEIFQKWFSVKLLGVSKYIKKMMHSHLEIMVRISVIKSEEDERRVCRITQTRILAVRTDNIMISLEYFTTLLVHFSPSTVDCCSYPRRNTIFGYILISQYYDRQYFMSWLESYHWRWERVGVYRENAKTTFSCVGVPRDRYHILYNRVQWTHINRHSSFLPDIQFSFPFKLFIPEYILSLTEKIIANLTYLKIVLKLCLISIL